MSKLFLIGDEDTVLGFRYAGIRGYVAKNSAEATGLFRKATEDKDVTIVVLTERMAEAIRPELDRYSEKRVFPFIVEIADASGPLPTRKSPSQIIKEAIGISI
jgi:V/A-type H+-transporting ATPase subunit F